MEVSLPPEELWLGGVPYWTTQIVSSRTDLMGLERTLLTFVEWVDVRSCISPSVPAASVPLRHRVLHQNDGPRVKGMKRHSLKSFVKQMTVVHTDKQLILAIVRYIIRVIETLVTCEGLDAEASGCTATES